MKKTIALLLVVMMALSLTPVNAEDLGVQVIGGPDNNNNEPLSFDDIKMEKDYRIDGFAVITPVSFEFVNIFAQWNDGQAGANYDDRYRDSDWVFYQNPSDGQYHYGYKNAQWKYSGSEADFAWLKLDIRNLKKSDVSYLADITVKVVYDDEYEYAGWTRAFYYDYANRELYRYNDNSSIGWPVCMGASDEVPVGMMYTGHYVCGCTLPNFVVNDKKSSLKMVIEIGGNELTYIIRK